jgi:predicted nucleic acid-binding protein
MRAGGVGNFENADALDWVSELEHAKNTAFIAETLRVVTERGDEYLEIPEACRALAAAEVVAALKHAGSSNLPIEVKQWVRKHPVPSVSLAELAVRAIQRVATASELNELWDESERASEWYEVIDDLEMRLKG